MFINKHQYQQLPEFTSPCGTGTEPVYKIEKDNYGSDVLVQCGEHDVYAEIQSYKEGLDIQFITANLDNSDHMVFGDEVQDLTKIPRSLGAWFNFQHDLQSFWNTLPPDQREEIGHIRNLPSYIKEKQAQMAAEEAAYERMLSEQEPQNQPSVDNQKGDE